MQSYVYAKHRKEREPRKNNHVHAKKNKDKKERKRKEKRKLKEKTGISKYKPCLKCSPTSTHFIPQNRQEHITCSWQTYNSDLFTSQN